ncbi:MAG: peptidoglycan DD-metalloendopeptidase family protein [Chloroflexota bacterium]
MPAGGTVISIQRKASQPASATPTPAPVSSPTPAVFGAGLRPSDAQIDEAQLVFPTAVLARRPPPYTIPLSINPNDHYWLGRPIPSDHRNYDHESYPYGQDLVLPQQTPYPVHHGLDFPNDPGTPILASSSGTVLWAGSMLDTGNGINYYGNAILILHDWQWLDQDVYTLYAHALELFVQVGDHVEQGQLLAGVGASGQVSGSHLHLEVRVGRNDYYSTRNPALWLAPFEGYGTLAGRLSDQWGQMIPNARVGVYPENVVTAARFRRTYVSNTVVPDEVWQENFVVGDLPAGRYTVVLATAEGTYRQSVEILPGQTTFLTVQTGYRYEPTSTPTPTPAVTP